MKDRIVKQAILPAPRERVWHAIADADNFGTWFGAEFDGPFEAHRKLNGRIRPTRMDPEIAKLQEPHAGMPFAFHVDGVESHRRISFRWHPYPLAQAADLAREPMTTITFELEDADKGTRVTITESGFDQLEAARRDAAHAANDAGWDHQLRLLRKFVDVPGG